MNDSTTALVSALNHVAVATENLERFVDFYVHVLGLELVFSEKAAGLSHAILRTGPQSWLHPVQVAAGAHGRAVGAAYTRGQLDHIALTASSPRSFAELRKRLVACGASDGSIEELGAFQVLRFNDPDGMSVELVLIVDPGLRRIHAPFAWRSGAEAALTIERLVSKEGLAPVKALLRAYVPWAADRITTEYGVRFDDRDGVIEHHHAAFFDDVDRLFGTRGRLLVAHLDGEPVGTVALRPLDGDVGEIKRLYVQPGARGAGVGRALIDRLIADAQAEGYRLLRLETMTFMAEAIALYRTLGFVDAAPADGAQTAGLGLDGAVLFMQLRME
jgi:ribosomal protein S18 acetylase RimI-like enzyme/catechol 2,3-dioxygenase-like lactoylglutathione lyase family enzyme